MDGKLQISDVELMQYIKSLRLKRLFREEQSIVLAKELSTYSTMFEDYKIYSDEFNFLGNIKKEEVVNVAKKVIKSFSAEIVYSK